MVQATEILKKQGFLQPTPGYKSKGFVRKGLPKFTVPATEEVRRRTEAEILDPMAKIGQHVGTPVPGGEGMGREWAGANRKRAGSMCLHPTGTRAT